MTTSQLIIDYQPLNKTAAQKIAIVTLNNEKSLNAQTLEMVEGLAAKLATWRDDDSVVAIMLRGAGEKAFSSGGDIRGLYHLLTKDGGAIVENTRVAASLFAAEYRLIYTLYHYPKPVIAYAHGITMGGGLGIAAAASHLVVTDGTMMAMPEVSIGLFPDALATVFLQKMAKLGLFLGLTGARWGADDVPLMGVNAFKLEADWAALLDALATIDWAGVDNQNGAQSKQNGKQAAHFAINYALNALQQRQGKMWQTGDLYGARDEIYRLLNQGDLHAIDKALRDYLAKNSVQNGMQDKDSAPSDNAYLKTAVENYIKGSPTTAAIVWARFFDPRHHQNHSASIASIAQTDAILAVNCCLSGEFVEGVRALLIDKDRQPKWRYTLADMPVDYVNGHFIYPFNEAPLADLV